MTFNDFFDFISNLASKVSLFKATPTLWDQVERIGESTRLLEQDKSVENHDDRFWPSNVLITACVTVAYGKKRFRSSVISEAQAFQIFIEFRRQDVSSDTAIKNRIDSNIDKMPLPSPHGFLRRIFDTPGKDFVSMTVRCFISETAADILGYSKDVIEHKVLHSFASNERLVKMGLLGVVLHSGLSMGTTSRLAVAKVGLERDNFEF